MIEIKKPESQEISVLQDEIAKQQALIEYLLKVSKGEAVEQDEQE